MKLLQGRKLVYGHRCLWCSTGVSAVSFVVTGTLLLMLLITMMSGTKLSAEEMRISSSLTPTKSILESKLQRYMVAQFSCLADLCFVMHRLRYTLASLISFGMMFSSTVYLLLLSLRKKRVRRCRVSSCLWTRRKVY